MNNEDTMRQEFRKLHPNSEMQEQFAEAWKACAAIKDAEIASLKAHINRSSLKRYNATGADEEMNAVERLRFFCSLAMSGQDWLDVESFFDDVIAEIADLQRSVKELREAANNAVTALFYGECSINERNPEVGSKNEGIARMMERAQKSVNKALAHSEHIDGKALEKALLEARIEALESAIESDYTVGLRDVISDLKAKLAELNKE